MKKTSGFTLIEVLIVVVIIAILAALAIPRFAAQTKKAQVAEAIQMIGAIKRAAMRYIDLGGAETYDLAALGIKSPPTGSLWEYQGYANSESKDWSAWAYYGGYATPGNDPLQTAVGNRYQDGVETWVCGTDFIELKDASGKTIGCQFK